MSNPGNQGSNQTADPWSGVVDPMRDVVNQGASLYGSPYQQYTGQRLAGPSDSTVAGQNLNYQRATLGAPDLNAARGMATDMAGGAFLGAGPTSNNNWLSAQASGKNLNSNPYVQQNSDWTRQVMQDNAADMASSYATGRAAQLDSQFARSGAYGGSAWEQSQRAGAADLAKQVGLAGNQYNLARTGLASSDYQNAQNSALGAAGMQQNAYQSDMGNMLAGGQLGGQLSQDDWTAANALRTQGNDQTAYMQKQLDQQYGDWTAQMNAPQQNLTNYANLLSQLGGYGSSGTSSTYGGGASPLGQIAGLGLLGAAGYNAWKG